MQSREYKMLKSLEMLIPGKLYDYRDMEHRGRAAPKKTRNRSIADVTSICLHQTAVWITSPIVALKIPAHCLILPDGSVVLNFRPNVRVSHGNGANRFSVGIEVSCMAAGIEGDAKTFWKPRKDPDRKPREATPEALEALEAVMWYYKAVCPNMQDMCAHRQFSLSRRSDPGSAIWKNALAVAKEISLSVRKGSWKGRKIPGAWGGDPGVKY